MKQGNLLLNRLFANSLHSIRQLAANDSEAKSFYRFLDNDKVGEEDIISNMAYNCQSCVEDKVVLCIQDSSEINLCNHRNRLKKDDSIGVTDSSGLGLGFFIHLSLVIDAHTFLPYGFSHVKVWNRGHQVVTKDKSHQKNLLAIEEKESYKWIEASLESKQVLAKAREVIIIEDREGDIYEQFCLVPDSRTHLLIRAKTNRLLSDKTKLFQHLSQQALQGSYQIDLEGDIGKGLTKPKATLEVRFTQVSIGKNQYSDKAVADRVSLYAIEARETTPGIEKPIHWRLLTSRPVENLSAALLCINWYSYRWMIEQVFRILKKEGFDIEASELSTGKAVRKLSLLMLETIIKLFIMQVAYGSAVEFAASCCFSNQEQACMDLQIAQLEGNTQKLNPYIPPDLKRYIWVIARLGGWKGYLSERKPGITTFWISLKRFDMFFNGFKLFNDLSTR
jgi:hypothetical protein